MAAGMGFTHTSTQPNIFGGRDEYRGGVLVSSSQPNIFGGFDKTVFSMNGHGDQHAHAHGDSALSDIIGYLRMSTPDPSTTPDNLAAA